MNLIEQLFNDFNAKYLEEAKNRNIDLGLQTVYTPIDKIEKATGFRFADHITAETKSVAVLFNTEFINYFIKEVPQDYINNIKFTFFYDCKFDYMQVQDCIFFSGNKLNIEMISIENIKDLDKVMAGKKFDIVFSNPPYSTKLYVDIDIKILNSILKIANETIFIMPSMTYIMKYFNLDSIKGLKQEFYKNVNDYLTTFMMISNNVFCGNCLTDQNLCITKFEKNKCTPKIKYYDAVANVSKTLNSINELTHYSSFDNKSCQIFLQMKEKLDAWLLKQETFADHFLGSCLQVAEKIEKGKIQIDLNSTFWMTGANGGGTIYKNNDGSLNKNFGIINSGTKEHFENNIFFKKDVQTLKELGKNRMLFFGNTNEEISQNWNFAVFSPIVKLIFFYYRSARCWGWNIIPWFKTNKTFAELCKEIDFSIEEINFIKDTFKDISPISWD